MKLYYKHTKDNYNIWVYWVKHNGFGLLPKLKINFIEHNDLYYVFEFTWWKLEAYKVKSIHNYD